LATLDSHLGAPNVAKAGRYYQRQLQDKALSPGNSPPRPRYLGVSNAAREPRSSPSPPRPPPLPAPAPPPRALGSSGRESRGSCRRLDARGEVGGGAACCHIAVTVGKQGSGGGGAADKQLARCSNVLDGPHGRGQLRRRLCHVLDTALGPTALSSGTRAALACAMLAALLLLMLV
jgi:hypothetical protein